MHTSTGIPIEALFAALGALVSVIFWSIKHDIGSLTKSFRQHDARLVRVTTYLKILGLKLGEPFPDGDDK